MTEIENEVAIHMTPMALTRLVDRIVRLESQLRDKDHSLYEQRNKDAAEMSRERRELEARQAVMDRIERKNNALNEYLNRKSVIINNAWQVCEKKLSSVQLKGFKTALDEAWDVFDKVQKEIQSEK